MPRTSITIPQGASWGLAWPILDEAGQPKDLTDWTVKAQIRATADSGTVLHEWNTATGTATVTDSRVSILLAGTTSAAWTWSRGVYDVKLTSPEGVPYRIAEGAVYVSPQVTR